MLSLLKLPLKIIMVPINLLSLPFKIISLPCSGKVDILYLVKAFETGADGAVVVTCKPGECRYLEGNLRAKKRVKAVDGLLEEIGLGRGRLAVVSLDDEGTDKIYREVKDFIVNLRNLLL